MKTGITGGIGSGKSYVCKLLAERGITVYDCDSAAKRLMRTSQELRQRLTDLIGPETYLHTHHTTEQGEWQLNKAAVAQFLLASEANAHAVDAIVHPAVFHDFEESGLQWMESAILFESGINRLVDRVIVVTAPEEVRIDRITSLSDIAMFTDDEDVSLMDVLENMKAQEKGKKASIDFKKATNDELREYFGKVLPNFDRDRVHNSDIKKLIQWYNILIENGITDFKEEEQKEETAKPETTEQPEEAKETKAPKAKRTNSKKEPKG